MRAGDGNKQTKFVSFSGIDGAGKSTQIRRFCAKMEQAGLRYSLVAFWDDVARFKGIREGAAHAIFKGDRGVGTPSSPVNRRDKNVRSWMMTVVRLCIYLADAVSTRSLMRRALRSDVDVVIFDRFVYDELANLNLENAAIRAYARMIIKLVPQPHISFLLDADPAKARARKPEYPFDFLEFSRNSYLALSKLIGCMTIIAPLPADEVEREVLIRAEASLSSASSRGESDRGQRLVESER
jgi:thymidylate kinase